MDESERIRDINARDYARNDNEVNQRLEFQHEYAQSALKTAVLVNGGAIIALFTFIGNDRANVVGDGLWYAFAAFVAGLFFAQASYFGAFFSQANYMNLAFARAIRSRSALGNLRDETNWDEAEAAVETAGDRYLAIGLVCAILSLVGFVVGSGFALTSVLP